MLSFEILFIYMGHHGAQLGSRLRCLEQTDAAERILLPSRWMVAADGASGRPRAGASAIKLAQRIPILHKLVALTCRRKKTDLRQKALNRLT